MQIYEGSARQDYEEVLRSIGAFLDQCGMREVSLVEAVDGFVVQGLLPHAEEGRPWNDPHIRITKETFRFVEDDVNRFIDEVVARRNRGLPPASAMPDHFYEHSLRVLGHYIDEQKPRDIMLFEQDRSFVLRLLMATRTGLRHVLAEFTREEIETIVAGASRMRGKPSESIFSTHG